MTATGTTKAFGAQSGLALMAVDDLPWRGLNATSSMEEFEDTAVFEKLVLPPPRKVEFQSLSPASSESTMSSPAWTPQPRSPLSTVIIFDWDDTLMCSSSLCEYVEQHGSTQELDSHCRKMAQRSRSMLELALRMGHTYIITNSVAGWVEHSATIWVPELLPLLKQVQIVSARDTYEDEFPDDAGQWKLQAFLEVCRQLTSPIENLVVIGDSDCEIDAAHALKNEIRNALIKTIRLQRRSTFKEHLRQLEVIAERFERIVKKPRGLVVTLEKKVGATQQ